MPKFKVTIPQINIHKAGWDDLDKVDSFIKELIFDHHSEFCWTELVNFNEASITFHGTAPSVLISCLMAIAQGDPVQPIIENYHASIPSRT